MTDNVKKFLDNVVSGWYLVTERNGYDRYAIAYNHADGNVKIFAPRVTSVAGTDAVGKVIVGKNIVGARKKWTYKSNDPYPTSMFIDYLEKYDAIYSLTELIK